MIDVLKTKSSFKSYDSSMKKITRLLLVSLSFPFVSLAYSWPLETISTYECSKQHFSTLDDSCLQTITKLHPDMYHTHRDTLPLRQTFSVLWWWTYQWWAWWDHQEWWHTWVDVVTAQWTPVYAIADGTVVEATRSNVGYGNVIKIKHTSPTGDIFYSISAHLEKLYVTKGAHVSQWSEIGTVWNSGNSTTAHLHFEIQTTTRYNKPRYPYVDCPVTDRNDQMNHGACRQYLFEHSMDPLVLLLDSSHSPLPSTPKTEERTPTRSSWALPPSDTRHREQAAHTHEHSGDAEKIKALETYDAIQSILNDKIPAFDTSKLPKTYQKFFSDYDLIVDWPEHLLFDWERDKMSLRLSWVHKKTQAHYSSKLPFEMKLITLKERLWLEEAQASDGSQLLFLTKRSDWLNLLIRSVEGQIIFAKPVLSI